MDKHILILEKLLDAPVCPEGTWNNWVKNSKTNLDHLPMCVMTT